MKIHLVSHYKIKFNFLLLTLVFIIANSCVDKEIMNDNEELVNQDIFFTEYETDQNLIYLYYKDSIELEKVISEFNDTSNYFVNDSTFQIENSLLFIQAPNSIKKTDYQILITEKGSNKLHPLKIKIRSWIKDKYYLENQIASDMATSQLIKVIENKTYTIINNILYLKIEETNKLELISGIPNIPANSPYNELVGSKNFLALRINLDLFISKDNGKSWQKIYQGSRGIKESMVFVTNEKGEEELLFSDYTPGTNYVRHFIRCYNCKTNEIEVKQTFYNLYEGQKGYYPFARHIHTMVKDPFTNFIFIATGDGNDGSSAIYYSKDNCNSIIRIGSYSQHWRTLSFFFTAKSIFWNNDCASAQYICRLFKNDLPENNVASSPITMFPLINSAHWCNEKILIDGKEMSVMSSNLEGCLYDERVRNFGIVFENEEPVIYELLSKETSSKPYDQYFPMGADIDNNILLCNVINLKRYIFKIKKYKQFYYEK